LNKVFCGLFGYKVAVDKQVLFLYDVTVHYNPRITVSYL